MNIKTYIEQVARESLGVTASTVSSDRSAMSAIAIARTVAADFTRAGIPVTADLTDSYKKQIDMLVQRMHAKRTPLDERVVVPYTAKLGEHNPALAALKDPLTKEPLVDVVLAKGRHALFNPANRVVHPIPVTA